MFFAMVSAGTKAASVGDYIIMGDEYVRSANAYLNEARYDEADLNYGKAMREYEQAIKPGPNSIIGRMRLAQLNAKRGDYWNRDYDKAELEYGLVLRSDPENAQAYSDMAYLCFAKATRWNTKFEGRMDWYVKAMRYNTKANELVPGDTHVLSNIFYVYLMTGRFGRDLERGISTTRALKGNSAILVPFISAGLTFLFIDKLSVILGAILVLLTIAYVLLRRSLKGEFFLPIVTCIWLMIVFINYFPKLFIPFVRLFLFFM